VQQQQQPPSQSPEADLSSALSLANIRQTLIRLEDTIIFSLIERAQFARNEPVYQPDAIPVPGFSADGHRYSLLEYLLREIEQVRWLGHRAGWPRASRELGMWCAGGGSVLGRSANLPPSAAAASGGQWQRRPGLKWRRCAVLPGGRALAGS